MKHVIVVGSGVIGLMCAVRLRKGGARVTLLEAEAEHPSVHGPIASAAAAGMLSMLDAAPSPHEALARESYDLWRESIAGAEWADGVRFDGAVRIFRDAEEAGAIAASAARLGSSLTPLSAREFRKRTGLETRIENAAFVADEGVADPLRVLTGLAMQARALGVVIAYGCDIESVTETSVTLYNERVYEADRVVLAPGAWATKRLRQDAPALRHVTPAKGHVVAVKLERPLAPNLHGPGFYIAQRREDVVLGATMEPGLYDRHVRQDRVDELLNAANAILPGEVRPAGDAWAGVRPMSPDGAPIVGLSGAVLVAAGHGRNGWLLAPITAEIITAYVFGAEIAPRWAALSPQRFETP